MVISFRRINMNSQKEKEDKGLNNTPQQEGEIVSAREVISKITELVHRVAFEAKTNVSKAKILPFSFILRENAISKIEDRVKERMALLAVIPKESISFLGEVSYSDLTTEKFFSLQELLHYAGHKKSPTDLKVEWKVLLANPPLMIAIVSIEFHTDTRKETETLELLNFPLAYIEYEIGGSDRDWVEETAAETGPILDAIRLRGIYKPLMIFRNKAVVNVVSWGTAIVVEILAMEFISRIFTHESKSKIIQEILRTTDIASKFDKYISYTFSERSIIEPLVIFGSAVVLAFISAILGYYLFPKFVPRSGILIGLEKERYLSYMNTFKFIVFSLFICGFGVAIIIEIIKAMF